jgi:hypothetical protein
MHILISEQVVLYLLIGAIALVILAFTLPQAGE